MMYRKIVLKHSMHTAMKDIKNQKHIGLDAMYMKIVKEVFIQCLVHIAVYG